ncbi:MAG: hypothetical protein QME78_00215 [Thermodesulfobacteriota bacterium]|nr:hypothetical protein [Thermodesulfobacteriota bacterium]
MVYAIHWNPYSRPDQEERRNNIRAAWDAWADFNSALTPWGRLPRSLRHGIG